MFNSQECSWSDVSIKILGVTVAGLRGFKFKTEVEKEHLYGAGGAALGIQHGNEKFTGEIKMLKNHFDLMSAAALAAGYKSIAHVPAQLIVLTCVFKSGINRPLQVHTCLGCSFTDFEEGMEQGAKFMEINLPILFLDKITV